MWTNMAGIKDFIALIQNSHSKSVTSCKQKSKQAKKLADHTTFPKQMEGAQTEKIQNLSVLLLPKSNF